MAKIYDDGFDEMNERRIKLGYPPVKRNANKSYDKLGREIEYIDGRWQTYDDGGYYVVTDNFVPNSVKSKYYKSKSKKEVKNMAKQDDNKNLWGHPQKTSKRYAEELKLGVDSKEGKFLTDKQKAYRAGYLNARRDSAEMYKYKQSKSK